MSVRLIIDHDQVRRNRARAFKIGAEGADFLLVRALDELEDRLLAVMRSFKRALCLGPASDRVAGWLLQTGRVETAVSHGSEGLAANEVIPSELAADGRFDLIVALFSLHETNDTPGVLLQLKSLMEPDGLFLACLPGSGTLAELRDSLLHGEVTVSGGGAARVLPFMDVRAAGSLLQRAGYAMPVTDVDDVTVRYGSLFSLMADLRAMGATNTLLDRPKAFARRDVFAAAQAHYQAQHADDDGRLRASFSIIWLSGWSPGDNQPKPLKPGSATVSLANVLAEKDDAD